MRTFIQRLISLISTGWGEGYLQFNSSLRLCTPESLEKEAKILYARGEIDAGEYRSLVQKIRLQQAGRGDLLILRRRKWMERLAAGQIDPRRPAHIEQSLDRVYLRRIEAEEAGAETRAGLQRLEASLADLRRQADEAHQQASQALPDEALARLHLEREQKLLEHAGQLEATLQTLQDSLARHEAMRHDLLGFQLQLESMGIQDRLAQAQFEIQEGSV